MALPPKISDSSAMINQLRQALIDWGKDNFRRFPWRLTTDPYQILVAEVMLHRTQASQVVPIYNAFIERYPSLSALSEANLTELHEILYSLGLRWRIDLLHDLAIDLCERFKGEIPHDRDALLSLPGVSEYIAGATRCFAWNYPEPLIDTNTVRITGRLYGLETRDSSRRTKQFKRLITAMVDPEQPRAFNYALLDLAHLVCLKKQPPLCNVCPIRSYCAYGKNVSSG